MSQPAPPPGTRQRRAALLWGVVRRKPMIILGIVVSSISAGLLEAATLAVVAQVASALALGDSTITPPLLSGLELTLTNGLYLALAFASGRILLQFVVAWLPAKLIADTQYELRLGLFNAFTDATWPAQSALPEGRMQELLSGQVNVAAQTVSVFASAVSGLFLFLTLAFSALLFNTAVATGIIVMSVVVFALLRPLHKAARRASRRLRAAQFDQVRLISQYARVVEDIDVFGVTRAVQQVFRSGARRLATNSLWSNFQMKLSQSIYQSVMLVLIVAGLLFISSLGIGNIADLGATVLLLIRAASYGQQVQGAYLGIVQSGPSLATVVDEQRRLERAVRSSGDRRLDRIETLEFADVSYRYSAEREALRGVSFRIERGETIGVVGPSGAGKSTLVQLLLGLRTPTAGTMLVNGEPAGEYLEADWAQRLALVPQEARIINGTIAANVRFFREIDDESVRRALRQAHLEAEVALLADGMDSRLGPGAGGLSGGQRQRLAIARAIAGGPDLLILDEPTSALDSVSEREILRTLRDLHGTVTTVIVAHKMSTLEVCDKIMVVESGRITHFDTPDTVEHLSDFFTRPAPDGE